MSTAIKLRGDTLSNWTLNNPVLLDRETVIETDTNRFKIGIGASYLSTPYTDAGLLAALLTKAPREYPEFIGELILRYNTPDGNENSDNIFSIVNTATGQIVFQINDYGNMQQFKNAYFEGDEFEAKNPKFTGSVIVPGATEANEAVNKGQLDLKQDSYTLQPVNSAGLINPTPTEKHFGIYVFTASTEFDITLVNCAIGSTIVLKNIGDVAVSVVSGGTMTLDGQNIDITTDGIGYPILGAYGSKKLYKNGASSWITIAETTTQEWISTSTITKYTKLGNTFIEL